ncbi:hypothetical protein DFH06DRAFT_1309402 [Mycena polygramma]|nr:hypothetical protein DFH06DRAFT_1309402 [Mycena polygramma]
MLIALSYPDIHRVSIILEVLKWNPPAVRPKKNLVLDLNRAPGNLQHRRVHLLQPVRKENYLTPTPELSPVFHRFGMPQKHAQYKLFETTVENESTFKNKQVGCYDGSYKVQNQTSSRACFAVVKAQFCALGPQSLLYWASGSGKLKTSASATSINTANLQGELTYSGSPTSRVACVEFPLENSAPNILDLGYEWQPTTDGNDLAEYERWPESISGTAGTRHVEKLLLDSKCRHGTDLYGALRLIPGRDGRRKGDQETHGRHRSNTEAGKNSSHPKAKENIGWFGDARPGKTNAQDDAKASDGGCRSSLNLLINPLLTFRLKRVPTPIVLRIRRGPPCYSHRLIASLTSRSLHHALAVDRLAAITPPPPRVRTGVRTPWRWEIQAWETARDSIRVAGMLPRFSCFSLFAIYAMRTNYDTPLLYISQREISQTKRLRRRAGVGHALGELWLVWRQVRHKERDADLPRIISRFGAYV